MSEAPLFQRTTDTVHGMFTPLLSHLVMMGLALVGSGEVPRGEKMLYSGTDPESYIT